MKLQYLTVMFIIIFVPILLVSTFFVQQQMKTIKVQLDYDTALLDATRDAMMAFEINTANEDLSTVSDSLRSIIEASNNIFLNTLAINMGMSNANKSFVQPYIPAILYSLYDGYYIYSPTYTPTVCTDKYGQTIDTSSVGVKFLNTKTVDGKTVGTYVFLEDTLEYDTGTLKPKEDTPGLSKVKYNDLKNKHIEEEYGQILYKTNATHVEGGKTYAVYTTVLSSDKSTSTYKTNYKIAYILKSYVPYAATYSRDDSDSAKDVNITINYTLDNYMSIMGDIGGIYYSKSGYFIDEHLINNIKVNGTQIDWYTYSDSELEKMSLNPVDYNIVITFNPDEYGHAVQISNRDNNISSTEYWADAQEATAYYCKAWAFSKWIYETPALYELEERDIVTSVYDEVDEQMFSSYNEVDSIQDGLLYDFSSTKDNDNDRNDAESMMTRLFYKTTVTDHSAANYEVEAKKSNPENSESNFSSHKRHVIRNSITYNLCLAMTAYNEKYVGMTFDMPILQEEEWDKILSNVSIVTFMQGLNCGHKMYNNYALVSSNNNEISVTPSEIFYTAHTNSIEDNSIETVHRINCTHLEDSDFYTSLRSKEIKYDKNFNTITDVYDYDHKVYTCYDCIVNPNYIGINGNKNGVDSLENSIYPQTAVGGYDYHNKIKAYYIALGKERHNLYKATELSETTAFEIINLPAQPEGRFNVGTDRYGSPISGKRVDLTVNSKYPINRISKIEVTIDGTCVEDGVSNIYTTSMVISLNGSSSMKYNSVVIPTTSATTKTIQLTGSFSSNSLLNKLRIELGTEYVNFNVKSVKIYYK